METQIVDWALRIAALKQKSADWVNLPQDFEYSAVKRVYIEICPHFGKHDIKARIAASRASNFHDLMLAIRSAQQ